MKVSEVAKFFRLVKNMRNLQKSYFETRDRQILQMAIKEERLVDDFLRSVDFTALAKYL